MSADGDVVRIRAPRGMAMVRVGFRVTVVAAFAALLLATGGRLPDT